MLNYYQPFLWPFLRPGWYRLPTGMRRFYYLSFEDGLWDLLRQKGIAPGSTLLLPDFYCMDVVGNIEQHGYRVRMYALDDHFQSDRAEVLVLCHAEKAKVLFLFHACGISCRLLEDDSFLEQLPEDLLLIEDCVHRLVDPAHVRLKSDQHFLIDSLRKDSPLPGSFLYGTAAGLDFVQATWRFSWYFLATTFWYVAFRLLLQLGFLLNLPNLVRYAHERTLKTHDDIIGDSEKSHRGLPWVPLVHRFLNFARLERVKSAQVRQYREVLASLVNGYPEWYFVEIPQADEGRLHVFPLGYRGTDARAIEKQLHAAGCVVWFKYPDAPWSNQRQMLYLPLGFHIREREIEKMGSALHALTP